MKPRIIALTGYMGAGKTTACNWLVRQHNYERVRFAGPLKSMLRALGCSEAEVDGDLKEQPSELLCGKTPREAMQTLGTEWGRDKISPYIWVSAWRAAVQSKPFVVVDDMRFPNEAVAVRSLGGKIWRVDRPGLVMGAHASETQALPYDATLYNDRDLLHLTLGVDALVEVFS